MAMVMGSIDGNSKLTKLLFHMQLIVLPWSIIRGAYLPNLFGYDLPLPSYLIGLTSAIKAYPSTMVFVLQIIWAPVVCSVEELSYEYAQANVPLGGVFYWLHQSFRIFTLCLQSFIGILMYTMLIFLSINRM